MNVGIKELPKSERPRERLLEYGQVVLSNEELLSILLGTGTPNGSAKVLATKILTQYQQIQDIRDANIEQLKKIKGIGDAKACTILAMVELGKRIHQDNPSLTKISFPNVEAVYHYYQEKLKNKKQEHFYCIYLDNKNHVIKDKLLFIGTINYSLIHPREIFKEAYLVSATSLICIHNHPSGNAEPSSEDKNMTYRLCEVGKLMGIRVLDHIIIGNNQYYSFLENDNI